jgi:hypothetical protein
MNKAKIAMFVSCLVLLSSNALAQSAKARKIDELMAPLSKLSNSPESCWRQKTER